MPDYHDNKGFIYWGPATGDRNVIVRLFNSPGPVAVDIETVSLEDRTIIGLAVAIGPDEAFWFEPQSDYLPRKLLTDNRILKIFHNSSFDAPELVDQLGIVPEPYTDTLLMAQVMGLPGKLNNLAVYHAMEPSLDMEALVKEFQPQTMLDVPPELLIEKCCKDAILTWELYHLMVDDCPKRALDLELRLQPVIWNIQSRGIMVDRDAIHKHSLEVDKQLNYFESICKGLGFNPGSSIQVAYVLQSRGHRIRFNRQTGKPTMTEELLRTQYADDPLSSVVLNYRHYRSLKSTYLEGIESRLDNDNILYIDFKQSGAQSGRIATSPNSQNIPRPLRDIFIPRPGKVYSVGDFSQMELRILAWMAQDQRMVRAFLQDLSIHKSTANDMFGVNHSVDQYKVSKNINFSVIYGGDDYTLYSRYQIAIDKARQFIKQWMELYPEAASWIDHQKRKIRELAYSETWYGRKRLFPEVASGDPYHIAKAEREGVNHIIQGTAGEINKEALIYFHTAYTVNTVHDEIINEDDPTWPLPSVSGLAFTPFDMPIKFSRGYNWLKAKPD